MSPAPALIDWPLVYATSAGTPSRNNLSSVMAGQMLFRVLPGTPRLAPFETWEKGVTGPRRAQVSNTARPFDELRAGPGAPTNQPTTDDSS